MRQPMGVANLGVLERFAYAGEGGYSTLPEGGPYPIPVTYGERVAIYKGVFDYTGPAITVYLHWGLKKGAGDFNNGANLLGGLFVYVPLLIPSATPYNTYLHYEFVGMNLNFTIPDGTPLATYDTYVWLSTKAGSALQADMVELTDGAGKAPDTDAGIIQVVSPIALPKAKGLNVAYIKI